jgi:hypothetical protein
MGTGTEDAMRTILKKSKEETRSSNVELRTSNVEVKAGDLQWLGRWTFALSLAIPIWMTGCQPATPPTVSHVGISGAPLPADRPATPDEAVSSDLSANRLHDIVGAILDYYVVNHNRLPDSLEDVRPFADVGTQLNFTSPSSGLPYQYSPAGLYASGQQKRIIVWEPKPDKQGIRWCILMPPLAAGKAVVPEVVPIQEKTFEAFIPAIQ